MKSIRRKQTMSNFYCGDPLIAGGIVNGGKSQGLLCMIVASHIGEHGNCDAISCYSRDRGALARQVVGMLFVVNPFPEDNFLFLLGMDRHGSFVRIHET